MDNIQLSQANLAHINNKTKNKNATSPIQPQVQQVKDGENKMNKVLLGLGILGIATIGITCVINGRKPKNASTSNTVQKLVKKFNEIDFNKGTARLKDGSVFTGAIEKVSENGDKLSLEYVDGILQKSTKTTNGVEVVKEYVDGVISKKNSEVIDIKKIQSEVKTEQAKLKQLLENKDLSSEEFQKQANEIKFKSKEQKTQIQEIFDKRVETEKIAEAKAERLAQEAQEKAQKEEAERLNKEQAEKAAREIRISKLKKEIEEEKRKFFEEHKDKLPPYEERYKEIEKYCRTSYGGNYSNELESMKCMVENDNRYLKFIWSKSNKAHELNLKLSLESMSKEELDLYNKAVTALQKRGLLFDELELSRYCKPDNELINAIINEEFATSYGEIIGHGLAYRINGALRAGHEVDDTLRIVLDEGFKTVKPLEHQACVYRHVTGGSKDGSINFINQLMNAKKGDTFTDKGYSYSTFKRGCAVSCNGIRDLNSPEINLEIIVPKGAKVSDGRSFEQCEMLFPRNAQFKIVEEAIQTGDNAYKMIIEYILP